ncbi:MAG: cytochrome c3 family protein [Terriglobales bacterium]
MSSDAFEKWTEVVALLIVFLLIGLVSTGHAQTRNSCVECHSALDAPLQVTTEQFAQDIHAQKGLTCASCHGGDPADESPDSMAKAKGFLGHIDRKQVPELCAKCHADGVYMRQYNPSLRTDELSQYKTSVHGKRLAAGDTNVAVCTDCHGLHGIRPASDPRSKVHPLNVADTCSRCHSDRERMKAYKIGTDQFAGYSASVHHEALTKRGDLSAPTCTTCHGNHGAAPPGVASVENVCSTCHVFQAQLFDKSKHKDVMAGTGGCITCHSNHRIAHPSDEMIGDGKQSLCTNCHSAGDEGLTLAVKTAARFRELEQAIQRSDELLRRAADGGMEVSQAKLDLVAARDSLTKARVTLHSFQEKEIEKDVNDGLKTAQKTAEAGIQALRERDYRRAGLGFSLLAIVVVLFGLRLAIKEVERDKQS